MNSLREKSDQSPCCTVKSLMVSRTSPFSLLKYHHLDLSPPSAPGRGRNWSLRSRIMSINLCWRCRDTNRKKTSIRPQLFFSGSLALVDVWFELWHLFLVTWDWFWCQNCAYLNSKKTTFAWGLIDIIVPYGLTWLWNMAHVIRYVKRWWCSSSQMVPWFPHELIPNKNPIEYPAW